MLLNNSSASIMAVSSPLALLYSLHNWSSRCLILSNLMVIALLNDVAKYWSKSPLYCIKIIYLVKKTSHMSLVAILWHWKTSLLLHWSAKTTVAITVLMLRRSGLPWQAPLRIKATENLMVAMRGNSAPNKFTVLRIKCPWNNHRFYLARN